MSFEPTRQQDEAIEKMANKYGAARVDPIPGTGDILVVGIAGGDVEMEYKRVDPLGNAVAAEHMREGAKTRVITAVPESFRLFIDGAGSSSPYASLADAAGTLASVVARAGLPEKVVVKAVVKGAQERELTQVERWAFIGAFESSIGNRAKGVIA